MKRPFCHYIRSLHRDIGFFLIGITILFCLSGILLIYRDTDFLKVEKTIEKEIPKQSDPSEIGRMLHIREFEVLRTEGEIVYFTNGTYNSGTGVVKYTAKVLPAFFEKINQMHTASSGKVSHWFSLVFGVCLMFLAITSFWMFKPASKRFRRGVVFAGIGLLFAVILFFL